MAQICPGLIYTNIIGPHNVFAVVASILGQIGGLSIEKMPSVGRQHIQLVIQQSSAQITIDVTVTFFLNLVTRLTVICPA